MYIELFFLVYLFSQNVKCIPKEYNVAILLEDYGQERIFRSAIHDVNLNKDYNFRLNPLMVSVNSDEPFSALNATCNTLTKGIVGIFGPKSPSNIHIVQSLCNAAEIPHILTHWAEPIGSETQINLYPQTNQLSNAYMDIILSLNWDEFTLLYVNAQSLVKLSEFIESAKTAGIIVYTLNLDPDGTGDYRPVLGELRKSTQTYFVLDCDIKFVNDVLFQIQQVGLLTSNHNYFLTNLDTHTQDLQAYLYSGADITGIQLVNYMENAAKETNLDSEAALIIDAINIFSNSLSILDVNQDSYLNCNDSVSWKDGLSVINQLKSDSHKGLTGDIQFDFLGQREGVELTIYKLKNGGIAQMGTWSTTEGISITQKESKETEETDISKEHFVVITTMNEPYSMYKAASDALSGNDRFEGFAIDLIHEISKIQEFTYTIIVREDGQNGIYNPEKGKWTGMIDDLISGKADLAISDMTITAQREDVVDFTVPFMHVGISILARMPYEAPPGLFHFARPFASDFWRAIAITAGIVVFSLYIVGRLCHSEWQKTNVKSEYVVNQLTLSNTLWFVAGGLFRQNPQVKIRSIPGRLIAATWGLFCFILIATYISSLINQTVSTEIISHFSDVKSLVENADVRGIKYGAKSGGATEQFFKNSRSPLYQEIYQHMEMHPEDMTHSTFEGVHRAESSNYAFFMESSTIDYMSNRMCDLTRYGGLLNEAGYGIAVRKGSPYLSALSVSILKLQTSGKLDALRRKWWEDKFAGNKCFLHTPKEILSVNNPQKKLNIFTVEVISTTDELIEDVDFVVPITSAYITGLIYITIFGIILAILGGILEFLIHTYKFSRKLNIPFSRAFRHEIKVCFSGKVKQKIDPTLLAKPTPEDANNEAYEAVELS